MAIKICPKCKDSDEFYKDNSHSDGLSTYCKVCTRKLNTGYRKTHFEQVKKRETEYKKNNPEMVRRSQTKYKNTLKARCTTWRLQSKYRGIPWDLKSDDLKNLPLVCYYTGAELTEDIGKMHTVSLDRLDSNLGYTKDNVVYCCSFINMMKHELSYDQFISACRQVVQHHDFKPKF